MNPMVGVIDGFRWCILGDKAAMYWPGLAASVVGIAVVGGGGVLYFRRAERSFADVI